MPLLFLNGKTADQTTTSPLDTHQAAPDATIDGEVVVSDDAGIADFERLHSGAQDRQAILYAFDLSCSTVRTYARGR